MPTRGMKMIAHYTPVMDTTNQDAVRSTVQPLVRFEQVTKRYGELEVIKGIDFTLQPGEKLALIGPSGSGKTTLGRMLMTLEQPTSGRI
jgi:polar amino acid transport system ATP-binding protein